MRGGVRSQVVMVNSSFPRRIEPRNEPLNGVIPLSKEGFESQNRLGEKTSPPTNPTSNLIDS